MRKLVWFMSFALTQTALACWADEAPYCRKVRARAAQDAALLMSPTIVSQGFRFPSGTNDPVIGDVGSAGAYQVRVGLTLSLVDIYKGLAVMSAADADCQRQSVASELGELLPQMRDLHRLPALRKEAWFLATKRSLWLKLASTAQQRFAARHITVLDYQAMQKRAHGLERLLVQVQGEVARIEVRALQPGSQSVDALINAYVERSDAFERQDTHVRSLAAWELRVTGGVVPVRYAFLSGLAPEPDWYGIVELRINLGALRGGSAYLAARSDEVVSARYEQVAKLDEAKRESIVALAQAKRELAMVEAQRQATIEARVMLEHAEAPNLAHAAALYSMDEIVDEAECTYLRALVRELSGVTGEQHG